VDVAPLAIVNCTGCSPYQVAEVAKGGPSNHRGVVTPTGNHFPLVTAPAEYTIPIRTPFVLTGSATDEDGETLTYMWEQTDRGANAGTNLLNNNKLNGPLFRQFGTRAVVSASDTLLYNSPGENAVTTDPTRVFPDMVQILINNTNAETGTCPTFVPSPATQPVPAEIVDCYSEFLPTAAYVGFGNAAGDVNASPLSLHFRLTARDGHPAGGGVNSATTRLLLATGAGPFLVTSPNTAVSYAGSSTQTVTWDVAGTSAAPVNTAEVRISLSVDGGLTYPYELAAATPNDGAEAVVLPNVGTTRARVRIEAVGNVFFDVSNFDFTVRALPVVTNDAPAGGALVQYSDSLAPTVTVTASDADSAGATLVASAAGLPPGLTLAAGAISADADRPGAAVWTVAGQTTAAPGTYPVTVTVSDDTGGSATTVFSIVVAQEDAQAVYTGDTLAFTSPGSPTASVLLRATVRDGAVVAGFGDTEPGLVTNATVTFKRGGVSLCGTLAVVALDGTTSGTATCNAPLGPGTHTIEVEVGGFYRGATTAVVEVDEPEDSEVDGEGILIASASAGTYKANAGSWIGFAIDVEYEVKDDHGHDRHFGAAASRRGPADHGGKHDPRGPEGDVQLLFKSGSKAYTVKTSGITSLGVAFQDASGGPCRSHRREKCVGKAEVRAKASLYDVSVPWRPVLVASNLSLQVTATDNRRRGTRDSIGLTLWNGSALLFSSRWDGTQTVEQTLSAGKIDID
jgi:hypothetical protein